MYKILERAKTILNVEHITTQMDEGTMAKQFQVLLDESVINNTDSRNNNI